MEREEREASVVSGMGDKMAGRNAWNGWEGVICGVVEFCGVAVTWELASCDVVASEIKGCRGWADRGLQVPAKGPAFNQDDGSQLSQSRRCLRAIV